MVRARPNSVRAFFRNDPAAGMDVSAAARAVVRCAPSGGDGGGSGSPDVELVSHVETLHVGGVTLMEVAVTAAGIPSDPPSGPGGDATTSREWKLSLSGRVELHHLLSLPPGATKASGSAAMAAVNLTVSAGGEVSLDGSVVVVGRCRLPVSEARVESAAWYQRLKP